MNKLYSDIENKKLTQANKIIETVVLLLLILSTTGCVLCGKPPNNVGLFCVSQSTTKNQQELSQFGNFPTPTNLKMMAEHNKPGQSSAFTGSAFIPAGAFQTYEAIVRFPPPFTVNPNGFLDIAPVGSNIGSYQMDLDDDGISDLEFPVLSESSFFAWMDINDNNMKDFSEPEVFQSQDINGNQLLVVSIPNGGDDNASVNIGNIGYQLKLYLKEGLFINPMIASSHTITATLQSVDPDTGGINNGSGLEPESIKLETQLIIDIIFKNDFE